MKPAFVLLALLVAAPAARAEEIVIDFEQAQIGKPVPTWTEKGVVFNLAGPLTQSKATGRIMFFPHLATNHKGILNAMATEQAIPVQATFPTSASAVTLVLWGSTGCPALLEALDKDGDQRLSKTEAASDKSLARTFAYLDADGNGFLTLREYTAHMKKPKG